jgi:hypothetical protein
MGSVIIFWLGVEEHLSSVGVFDEWIVDGIFFPHEFVLVHTCEAESTDADENLELLLGDIDTMGKVFQTAIITV